MRRVCCFLLIAWGAQLACAGGSAFGDEPQQDVPKADVAAKAPADVAKADAKPEEFKPPPGFLVKKRGSVVLYCKQDTTVGTRFKTEKCYSEAQVRDYLIAQQENKRDIDRIRATCSSGAGQICSRQ